MPKFLGKRQSRRSHSAPGHKRGRWAPVDRVTRRRARAPRLSLVGAPVSKAVYFEAECVCRQFDMKPTQNIGTGDNFIVVNRYDYSGIYPQVGSGIGVDDSPRFNQLRPAFREFAITGVKIEMTPNDRENVAVNG